MLSVIKFGLPVVGAAGALAAMSHAGLFSSNENKTELVDTSRDYFLLANNNISSMNFSANYPSDEINTTNKNFKCQIVDAFNSNPNTNTDSIFDCDIYKYQLNSMISKDLTENDINPPLEDTKLTKKLDLFKDNLFQIVVTEDIFNKQKANPNLKIRILKNGVTANDKWFSNLEGLGWFHKNQIQESTEKNKAKLYSEINKVVNTSYLLTKIVEPAVSNTNTALTTENSPNTNPKVVNYNCKISFDQNSNKIIPCRVYSVDETNWSINSSKLQPPVESKLINNTSEFAKEKYYQIKLDSKDLNNFRNKKLTVSLLNKQNNNPAYQNLENLFEFRRGQKIGKAQHIAVQVKSKLFDNDLNSTDSTKYKYISTVNNIPNKQITIHNLFSDPNGEITNKNQINTDANNIKTINLKSSIEGQANKNSIKENTILIMSVMGNDRENYFNLYDLVGSEFNVDINIVNDTSSPQNETKKGSLVLKVIGTITIRN